MTITLHGLLPFFLVLVRLSGFGISAPFFSSDYLSLRLKVGFLVVMSAFLAGTLPRVEFAQFGAAVLVPAVAGEFAVGLCLGLGFRLAMTGASLAGEIVGLQMGLGSASLFDPDSGQSGALLETFYGLLFTVVFVMLNGHHHMLRVLAESFGTVPPGSALVSAVPVQDLVAQVGAMLVFGFRLAAPVLVPLFLLTVALSLVARAFPQANILSFSFGLSILAGCLLLAASVPGLRDSVAESVRQTDHYALRVLQAFSGT